VYQHSLADAVCDPDCACRAGSDLLIVAEVLRKFCWIIGVMANWLFCNYAADNWGYPRRIHELDEIEILPTRCGFEASQLKRSKLYSGFLRNRRAFVNNRLGCPGVLNMEISPARRAIPEF
jgi:hypothetical protein